MSEFKMKLTTSHELKNQLAPIYSLSQMIKDQFFGAIDDTKNKRDYLNAANDIWNAVSQMIEFLNDVMDVEDDDEVDGDFDVRLRQEKIGDVVKLVKKMVKLYRPVANEKGIAFEFRNDGDFYDDSKKLSNLEIRIDLKRTKQILINLISNAIKYSKLDSKITISTAMMFKKDIATNILISIKDQGVGMSREEIKMALDGKGKQIDKSQLDHLVDSHGIGLPLVKSLAERQDIKLDVKSEKGKGTEVILGFGIISGKCSKDDILEILKGRKKEER